MSTKSTFEKLYHIFICYSLILFLGSRDKFLQARLPVTYLLLITVIINTQKTNYCNKE